MASKSHMVLLSVPANEKSAPVPLAWLLNRWWIAFAGSAIFVVSGHLLIKAGLNSAVPAPAAAGFAARALRAVLNPEVLGGLIIYLTGTICWMRAVSQKEISFLYPLSSVNYVLVAAASAMLFQEAISAKRAGGVLLVVLGMILMNRRSGKREAWTRG
jgi:drug/metabolite transporter (DMT)-like permease